MPASVLYGHRAAVLYGHRAAVQTCPRQYCRGNQASSGVQYKDTRVSTGCVRRDIEERTVPPYPLQYCRDMERRGVLPSPRQYKPVGIGMGRRFVPGVAPLRQICVAHDDTRVHAHRHPVHPPPPL
eukprot:491463-Rhodomonas_salina.1